MRNVTRRLAEDNSGKCANYPRLYHRVQLIPRITYFVRSSSELAIASTTPSSHPLRGNFPLSRFSLARHTRFLPSDRSCHLQRAVFPLYSAFHFLRQQLFQKFERDLSTGTMNKERLANVACFSNVQGVSDPAIQPEKGWLHIKNSVETKEQNLFYFFF